MNDKFYVTTPIYYVNAAPHMGHAYTTIVADVLARFHRMTGDKTFFLTGTDEHGAKIEEMANKAGKEPKEFVDEIAASFQFAWDELNISNDNFLRTTDPEHIKAVQSALQYMYDKGDIYKGGYEGLYCRQCEQYKSEKDLIGGLCADHKIKPELMREECYMFRLSKYQDELLKKIESDEFKILPAERKNEIVNFYKKDGLQDISFSRKNVKWGVPLPWDKSHTAYVWADAFLNYLTGLGWPSFAKASEGKDGKDNNFKIFWPSDVQLMSKDILRVHATIWPAMLLSIGLPLPKMIFVHGYFLIEGQKMSKSLGNVIAPEDLVKKYGIDGTRYLLLSATSFGHDGDIGWKFFDEKYNADLANGLGNLVARTASMVESYFGGKISLSVADDEAKIPEEIIREMFIRNESWAVRTAAKWEIGVFSENMKKLEIDKALHSINRCVKILDRYISAYKPFKLIKEDKEKTAAVLYNCLEFIRIICWLLWPFTPETAEKIYAQLGLDLDKEIQRNDYRFEKAVEWGGLKPNIKVKKGDALFPRI